MTPPDNETPCQDCARPMRQLPCPQCQTCDYCHPRWVGHDSCYSINPPEGGRYDCAPDNKSRLSEEDGVNRHTAKACTHGKPIGSGCPDCREHMAGLRDDYEATSTGPHSIGWEDGMEAGIAAERARIVAGLPAVFQTWLERHPRSADEEWCAENLLCDVKIWIEKGEA